MSSQTNQKILTFVKKYKDELLSTTAIDEFAELLEQCFSELKPDQPKKEKVNVLYENLSLDDSSDALVEGDLRKYIERLVDFVDGTSDDPLEKNNLKQRSSSGSSDEDDNRGHSKIQSKNKRDRSRDREKNKKSKKNQKGNSILSELQKVIGKDNNLKELLTNLANNNNRRQQQHQNNKNVVFLQNVPKEMRTYSEIEALLKDRGVVAKIQLAGRVPSVQFKNQADAQALVDKFIVHKGMKIEFTSTLNKPHSEDNKNKVIVFDKEGKKTVQSNIQPAAPVAQVTTVPQKPEGKIEEENDPKKSKEEHELNTQLEALKGQAKTLVVDKLRLALLLCKRKDYYPQQLNQDIDELKRILVQKKEDISKMTTIDQVKQEIQWLNENYDFTIEISDIPELLFKEKTVTKALTEEFQKFGKIDSLQIRIKDKAAHLKFVNFESAEKAFTAGLTNFKVEFLNKGIKKIVIAQN